MAFWFSVLAALAGVFGASGGAHSVEVCVWWICGDDRGSL